MSSTIQVDESLKEKVGPAIGRLASGVHIVTIKDAEGRDGMLATWIAQAAFAPPMVSIAVNRSREIMPRLKEGSHLAVNVLSKNNMDIFKAFARPFQEGMDRFEGLDCGEDSKGSPYFSKAVGYMSVQITGFAEAGDHVLVLGEVVDGAVLNGDDEPMVHLRKNGFQY
ncbi:MAG: flavin reductase family protein [Candidatus Melainabacteria bacterium]|nr:flavin reductase family protein [Candidatus Melainabacteria bacterium]